MSLFKRGLFSIIRKPKKSMLLAAIIYFIGLLLMVAVGINGQQSQVQNEIMNQIGGSFRLELNQNWGAPQYASNGIEVRSEILEIPDLDATMNFSNFLPTIGWDDIDRISQIGGIERFNVTSQSIRLMPLNFENDKTQIPAGSRHQTGDDLLNVTGIMDLKTKGEVEHGLIHLKEGRWIEASDFGSSEVPLVISEAIAVQNGLSIGDVLEFGWEDEEMDFVLEHFELERAEPQQISGTIVGIFTIEQRLEAMRNDLSLENAIFSKLDFGSDLFEGTRFAGYAYNLATFEVGNVSEYEAIKNEILSLNLNWDRYNLVDAKDMLSTLSSDFNGLEQLSKVMFWVIFTAGFAMLWLIFILWIRNRNHEVAILLAVGTEKVKIVLQFVFEALLVAGISFSLAIFSLPLVNQLIDVGDLAAQFQQGEPMMIEVDGEYIEIDPAAFSTSGGQSMEDLLGAEFTEMATSSVSITPAMIGMVLVSLVGLIGFTIVVAMIPVMRLKPKEIFAKMS